MPDRKWKVEQVAFVGRPALLDLPPGVEWCVLDSEFYNKYTGDLKNLVIMDYEIINAGIEDNNDGGQVGVNAQGELVIEVWNFDLTKPPSEWEITRLTEIKGD